MHLLSLCVLILSVSVTHQQIYCVTKCSCGSINPATDLEVVMDVTDCCDSNSTAVKGNVNFTNSSITECVLCPSFCGSGVGACEIDPTTTVYSANITRPTAGHFLFTVAATYTCPEESASSLSLVYSRGPGGDNLFTTVGDSSGDVSIVFANAPNEIREYTGAVNVQLYNNSVDVLAESNVPFDFNVYDAIAPNATEYTATTTNSKVGGLYLFTVGTTTPGFTVVYSIKPSIGDPNSISINTTTGHAFTSTTQPPTEVRSYIGVVLFTYSSDTDPSLTGLIEVQFTFTIVLPLTPNSTYNVFLPFPATTPQDVLAFIITYSFLPGFSLSSFTYDFNDTADILNLEPTTGRFSFPFSINTEVKRFPDSGSTEIIISYFSKEMFLDGSSNNQPVYQGSLSARYSVFIIDNCGYSAGATPVCENGGECVSSLISFSCNCTATGYTGDNCEINLDECAEDTALCLPGECHDTNESFFCDCIGTGFEGSHCTVVINQMSTPTTMLTSTINTATPAPVAEFIPIIGGAVGGLLALALFLFIVMIIVLVVVLRVKQRKVYLQAKASTASTQPLQPAECIEINYFNNEDFSSSPTKKVPGSNVYSNNSTDPDYPDQPSIINTDQ